MSSPLFDVPSSEQYGQMREVLRAAGYHEQGLIDVLGPIQLPTRAGGDLPYFLYLTRALCPVDVLIRLFLIGSPVDQENVARAVGPMSVSDWARAGLLAVHGGMAHGRVRLMPFRGMILACDYVDAIEPGGSLGQVMGLTASSVALADFTVRRPVEAALDLGAGGGIQAFLAAAHSRQVIGVDRSARSVEFARFNAKFNGIDNCAFLEGDGFEPVQGRKFALVISNPPFAVTPSFRYMYRDSGVELDGFCRKLVRQVPEFLDEGGIFQMAGDWVHLAGRDWKERLFEWFEHSGCDIWVLRTETHSAADYARIWLRDTEHETPESSARLYEEWMAYYEARGVEAVSTGLIAMRRTSSGSNRLRIEDLPEGSHGPVGAWVAAGLQLRDYLETVSADEALLGQKLRVSPPVRLEDVCEPSNGAWRVVSARIRMSSGLTYASPVDLRLAGLLARCDGKRTVRELIAELAATTGSDLERITPNCLSLLRELVERGFLLPAAFKTPAAEE